jgi:hypothetical protein
MIVGSLVDAWLLEPPRAAWFAVKDFDARTSAGKARRDELAAAGIEVLSQADWDRAGAIADAVRDHPWWKSLTFCRYQTSVDWLDAGHACKGRPDVIARHNGKLILCDLKVCRQAAQSEYPRACASLWHPQQLAWYSRGLLANGMEIEEEWIMAVHPLPPHEATAYRISAGMRAWAAQEVEKRYAKWCECAERAEWPAGEAEVTVDAPAWAEAQMLAAQFDEEGNLL